MLSLAVVPAWLVTWAFVATRKVKDLANATPTSAAAANPASAAIVAATALGLRARKDLRTRLMLAPPSSAFTLMDADFGQDLPVIWGFPRLPLRRPGGRGPELRDAPRWLSAARLLKRRHERLDR